MGFPVIDGRVCNGVASQPKVTAVTTLHLFLRAVLLPEAKKRGLTVQIFEDSFDLNRDGKPDDFDIVDYRGHNASTNQTWHNYQEVWFGKGLAGAADCNVVGPRELDFFRSVIIPKCKDWGIGYHLEGAGTYNQHLHLDVGIFSNDGQRWYKGTWEGRPNFARSGVLACDSSWGPTTVKGLQKMLRVPQDGVLGPNTTRALQKWLVARGQRQVRVDGVLGPTTKAAMSKVVGTASTWGQGRFNLSWQIRINATNFKSSSVTAIGAF